MPGSSWDTAALDPVASHRREGDEEDHFHERAGNGIDVDGPYGTHVQARGQTVFLALLLMAGVGGMAWVQYVGHGELVRMIEMDRQDHRDIKLSEDRMSCILTLNQEDRERFRKNWHPGIAASFCPWVEAR